MKKQEADNGVFLEMPNNLFRFVNIEGLKKLQKKIAELKDIENTYPINHCQNCGDTEPKHGFYPLWGMAVGVGIYQTSGLTCNRCARTYEDYLITFKEPKEVFQPAK